MRVIAIFLMLLMLFSCSEAENKQGSKQLRQVKHKVGVVIARVGVTPFYEADIDMAFAILPESVQVLRDDLVARSQILHTLIRRHVLAEKAVEMKLNQAEILSYQIQESRNDLLIDALQTWKRNTVQEPTEKELASYFDMHKLAFQTPEQVHVRHVILATRDEALAFIARVKEGEDFAKLASELSLDENSKIRGGSLNWFGRDVMDKTFEEAVFSIKEEGQLSAEFQTQFGWHVALLMGRKNMQQKPFEEVKDEIKQQLKHQVLQQWLDTLVAEKKVQMIRAEYSLKPHPITDSRSSN